MIRRGFWLTAGAVGGIYGYRRVSAMGRRLSASLNPGTPGTPGTRLAPVAHLTTHSARRGALRLARETYRFTRDVREGMEHYRLAQSAPGGSTLSTDRSAQRSTDHDVQPEDGH